MFQSGFFNISSGNGCQKCDCNPIGALENGICDAITGKCHCKPGVIGAKFLKKVFWVY